MGNNEFEHIWNNGDGWHYADIDDLIRVYEPAPTVEAEPTEEQVREYCRKRCLTLVTDELFDEMQAKWSNEPVRHGYWWFAEFPDGYYHWECSECNKWFEEDSMPLSEEWKYCPNCGAKMDGERREDGKED